MATFVGATFDLAVIKMLGIQSLSAAASRIYIAFCNYFKKVFKEYALTTTGYCTIRIQPLVIC